MATPALTRNRLIVALCVAAFADVIQLPVTAVEATGIGTAPALFFDFTMDVAVCVILSRLIGFHWMLLPTFFMEVIPGLSLLPTWLGCTLFVLRLRKKHAQAAPPPIPAPSQALPPPPLRASSAVIDV